MPILVQKFGGSSVADLERLRRVASKIAQTRARGYDLVVVVSAMGDTTDELLEMARHLTETPSRRELDMLLSVGERISMALLSMAIHDHGLEAISFTGSQVGIITTASHSRARIIDVRPFRVQDELEQGRIVIVAGYQGTSYKREVTTLGRGGSDTTAVALAAALGAQACEIYSDVDGVFSADPRVVLNAHKLETLTHGEMMEMARAGASVLNEDAVAFAKRAGIALHARSTHDPSSRGTVVRPDGFSQRAERAEQDQRAVAVSHMTQGLYIHTDHQIEQVLEALATYRVALCDWIPRRTAHLFLSVENIPDHDALTARLGRYAGVEPAGLVSVVGDGIGADTRWSLLGQRALAEAQIPCMHLSVHGARLSYVVDTEHVERAANLLHAIFLES